MIKATLKTMNGKEVKLEIPQSASEIPLKRFIRARIAYYEIDALFGEKTFGTEYRFLQKVIEFIAFVLSVDANELMGFKTGSIKSNAETLAFGVTQTQKWKSIDTTIYQLYSYLASVFRQAGAKEHKGDLHFKYKGDKYFIPKFIRTGLQSGNVVPIDLFGWQGIELAEVQRQVEAYADTLTSKNEYGSEVDLLSLTEEQQDKYADIQYNGYLNALAIMTRKEGDNISELAMKGNSCLSINIRKVF